MVEVHLRRRPPSRQRQPQEAGHQEGQRLGRDEDLSGAASGRKGRLRREEVLRRSGAGSRRRLIVGATLRGPAQRRQEASSQETGSR